MTETIQEQKRARGRPRKEGPPKKKSDRGPGRPPKYLPPPPKAGRPQEIFINVEEMEKVAGTGATQREIAAHFGCSIKTLELYLREDVALRQAYDSGLDKTRVRLRSAQISVAIKDRNPTMLIWAGKQLLGQRDNVDITAKQEKDVSMLTSPQRLALINKLLDEARENEKRTVEGEFTEVKDGQ